MLQAFAEVYIRKNMHGGPGTWSAFMGICISILM